MGRFWFVRPRDPREGAWREAMDVSFFSRAASNEGRNAVPEVFSHGCTCKMFGCMYEKYCVKSSGTRSASLFASTAGILGPPCCGPSPGLDIGVNADRSNAPSSLCAFCPIKSSRDNHVVSEALAIAMVVRLVDRVSLVSPVP